MADTITSLLVLNRKDLKNIQEKFDEVANEMKQVAEKRFQHH